MSRLEKPEAFKMFPHIDLIGALHYLEQDYPGIRGRLWAYLEHFIHNDTSVALRPGEDIEIGTMEDGEMTRVARDIRIFADVFGINPDELVYLDICW